ncbi:MAG: PHP domain-containing protein [Victivallaceae bacterium]|nr:PHP domain-containing protein [Victivallaceae bacterium]
MIFFSDMHIHTLASACCHDEQQTPENIIQLLKDKGYQKVGFVDHIWLSEIVAPSGFYQTQNGAEHLKLHEFIHSRSWDIAVMVGCEADMTAPGVFGITPEFKARMDYVVMATDHFHMREFVQQPAEATPACLAQHLLKFFISAATSGLPDILVHPLFPFGYLELYDKAIDSLSDAELIDAFAIAAENNIGIEINSCYLAAAKNNHCFSLATPTRLLTLAKQAGCTFTLGSDAHTLQSFAMLDKLQQFVVTLGLNEHDIHWLANTVSSTKQPVV